MPFAHELRHCLDRLADDRRKIDELFAERDLAARYSRDVEQIVDEPGKMPHLTLDHVVRPGQFLTRLQSIEELRRAVNRGKRVSKLVSEHREKLVLPPIRLHALSFEDFLLRDLARNF